MALTFKEKCKRSNDMKIQIEDSVFSCKRGVYGIFIIKNGWVYMAFPVTVVAVLIGMITNVWSPYAPIIILFCCLLVTTCKLLIESRGKDE